MRSFLVTRFAAAMLLFGAIHPVQAQVKPTPSDTTKKYANPGGVSAPSNKPFLKSKLFKAVAIPAVLITYGAITAQGDAGINHDARTFVQKQFRPVNTMIDNTVIFLPYVELGAVALAGVESRNDRINTLLIIAKGEAIMLASTFAVKYLANETRPNGADNLSFPSGHTAQAFLAASIVHTEFRDKSQWYGVGAYTIATSVAALRMINDKHWQSDVVAGAGFGILSAHLAYLSHRNRWGRKSIGRDVSMTPSYFGNGASGVSISWRPSK
ncbi:phosphatase PAP2 family protein [Microvirga sp. STS02]|uniref:phosphatase PAP2 family protein n=1 Tax=Hymenobacter negativus TaxID=2795026 RepID=UPI0018DB46A8|nr:MULTISPECIES: phosphatase PAP2 family protein [Bacteria]MBH8571101.1 phosphatase PAP2 family protein [Hymenobacter negativus]MBR7210838.1 phosphatase PAP2 family protein [Microvirga sp. STS02]